MIIWLFNIISLKVHNGLFWAFCEGVIELRWIGGRRKDLDKSGEWGLSLALSQLLSFMVNCSFGGYADRIEL